MTTPDMADVGTHGAYPDQCDVPRSERTPAADWPAGSTGICQVCGEPIVMLQHPGRGQRGWRHIVSGGTR